jgi:hypothetical protein
MNGPIHEVPLAPRGSEARGIAFEQVAEDDRWGIWMLSLDVIRKPYAYLQTPFNERMPAFSPDGRWLAYAPAADSGTPPVVPRLCPASCAAPSASSVDDGLMLPWVGMGNARTSGEGEVQSSSCFMRVRHEARRRERWKNMVLPSDPSRCD